MISFNFSNLNHLIIFISNLICRIQWITLSLWYKIWMSNVSIINVVKSCLSNSCQASWFRSFNVFSFQNVFYLMNLLLLWPCTIYIVVTNLITNKSRRSNWSHLNLCKLIMRIQRIVIVSCRFEFYTIRIWTLNITVVQVQVWAWIFV